MRDELEHWRPALMRLAASGPQDDASGADGAHDASHLERVWRNACELLAGHPEADALVVLAACCLHDLVNVPKNDPRRTQASRLSAERAAVLLDDAGFPAEKIPAVAHAIAAHSFSAGVRAETLEARIVQDADRLDGLGAVGLARLFYTAGRMGSGLAHPADPLGYGRALDDKAYALDHIPLKLARLPGMMQTEAGRRVAQRRLGLLEEFRAAFAAEWSGE